MWDEKYDVKDYIYGTEPNEFLANFAQSQSFFKSKKNDFHVLDLACGEGRNTKFLSKFASSILAIDKSAKAIEKAKKLVVSEANVVEWQVADVLKTDFESKRFDLVCSIFLHLPRGARLELYDKVRDCLKPGGLLVIESYRKEQNYYKSGGPPTDKIMPSLEELQEAFNDFELLIAQEMDRPISEGTEHTGIAAVVQFVARKRDQ